MRSLDDPGKTAPTVTLRPPVARESRAGGQTILQVFHTLAVGGVGSYLLNLSAGLIARGHRVVLAAPPGDLTPEFQRRGVYCIPVRISDWHLLRSRRDLAGIIRREHVDLVHAHDYSAGAAAYLAARCTGTPHLLTIHCRRPWWQRLVVFYWSARVVTISPDLRSHLTRNMGLPRDRIIQSFIGVDVAKFAPAPPAATLVAEFGLVPGQPVIVHVSRLSTTKSPVAFALIDAVIELDRAHPGLIVLLAGTGEDEGRVRAAANRVNAELGREAVHVLGTRNDVPELLRLATVVVGTASVALEALASGCALVAAGKVGLVGAVTPANFAAAAEGTFGDHGCLTRMTTAGLAAAVTELLDDSRGRPALAAWGRQVVTKQFSMERMTDQIESIYAEIAPRSVAS